MDKKEMNKKKYRVKQQRAVSGAVCWVGAYLYLKDPHVSEC